jgi:hypothetical protein
MMKERTKLLVVGLVLWAVPVALRAGSPDTWVPVRWDGGPLEVVHRTKDKALADPAVRQVISRWYEPATLDLLSGTRVNCLLVTLSAGADPEVERKQHQLVKDYARVARERGFAVLGLVYPGADPAFVAAAAADARLDGLVLEGEFPGGPAFAEQLEKALRANKSAAVVIPVASSPAINRKSAWPVRAVQGTTPGAAKVENDTATASASGGQWIDSNMWLVRSYRLEADWRPVWVSHRPAGDSPQAYLRSVADAAAAGGRWIVTLDDGLRASLFRKEDGALATWRSITSLIAFYEDRADWRSFAPFGKLAIIPYSTGPNQEEAEEYLNLIARRHIPYKLIDRAQLGSTPLGGFLAVLALTLAPPSEAERKILSGYAAAGGMVIAGPSWGGAPEDQSYTVVQAGKGGVTVYREEPPDPQAVTRDLFDLLFTEELGVSVFDAPSVLSYVSTADSGKRMLIHLVNYAGQPAEKTTIWVYENFDKARLYTPEGSPLDLIPRRSGSRIEIAVPKLAVCGALLLE